MLQRVARKRSFTLYKTFQSDGVASEPTGTPTVTITRDDGTSVSTGAVTDEPGVGAWSVTVAASSNPTLDVLAVDWAAVVAGESQEYLDIVEVVGGFLFTIAQARALAPLSDTVKYPTQAIVDARTMVETALEDACGVAFVPRYRRESVSGWGGREVLLTSPRVTALRSVNLDGSAVSNLADIVPSGPGVLYNPAGWTRGFHNYEVAYEHGYANGPEAVEASQVALTWAKVHLVKGPIDDRATGFSTEDGTFSLSTPGQRGAVTGIPVVDSFIQRHDLTTGVA